MLLSLQTYQPQSLSPRCGVTLSRFTWYLHGIEYSWPMGSGTIRRCGHVGISRVVGPLSAPPQGTAAGEAGQGKLTVGRHSLRHGTAGVSWGYPRRPGLGKGEDECCRCCRCCLKRIMVLGAECRKLTGSLKKPGSGV